MQKIQNEKAHISYVHTLALAFVDPGMAFWAGSVSQSVAKSYRWVKSPWAH
jgi:hypothetical protein